MTFTAIRMFYRHDEYWLTGVRSGRLYWYKEGYNSLFEDGSFGRPLRITEEIRFAIYNAIAAIDVPSC